jgi:hypothetical protein
MAYAFGAPSIVQDGLVFYVDPANKDSYPGSGTVTNTLIGDNVGTLQSSNMFENINAGAFALDGADEEITFANSTNFPVGYEDFTISLWFKADPTDWGNNFERGIFSFGDGAGAGNEFKITMYRYTSDDDARITIRMASWSLYNPGNLFNVWHNVTVTHTNGDRPPLGSGGTTYRETFFNNISLQNKNIISVNLGTANPVIGNYANQRFKGQIGPIIIYNKKLSNSELTQNYNALKPRFI